MLSDNYSETDLNTFAFEQKQQIEEISLQKIIGKGYNRSKIIVRLKLEEILSHKGETTSKYVKKMNLNPLKLEWMGYLSTTEIANSIGSEINVVLRLLKDLKNKGIVKDRYIKYPFLGDWNKKNKWKYKRKIHMWKIVDKGLVQQIYETAYRRLGYIQAVQVYHDFILKIKSGSKKPPKVGIVTKDYIRHRELHCTYH